MHDSMTPLGGGVTLANIMLGEVSPGGVGAGLYGMLVLAVLTVFLAGLMVGRTPEYLGKKIGRREVTFVALYILTMPTLLLSGAALTAGVTSLAEASVQDPGPHGLTEILYAYASAANNNGSAFAGFGAATDAQNIVLGVVMLLGRFVPIVLVLGLAGALARQRRVPPSAGTLPTTGPVFVGLLFAVVLVVVALTFLPALALSPIAEALQ
jgi:K+-transporting ATPase ATPase A chain